MTTKSNILLIGSGGVGTMAAYALESGGLASVTAILRSNFDAVNEKGFTIDSIDHGLNISGWKPTTIRKTIPDLQVERSLQPYNFIIVTTKNIPEIPPSISTMIAPAVTPGHTAILLLQNGLNIEKPVQAAFPHTPILSGISMIGATELSHGHIRHDEHDSLKIGAWPNPTSPSQTTTANDAAHRIIKLYSACGVVSCTHDTDVRASRWRKLLYNSSYNVVATILRMDVTRMRIHEFIIDELVRPAMLEIKAVAAADGVAIDDQLLETLITVDAVESWFRPSMYQDIEKGNYIEVENIVGEPVREAARLGVEVPILKTVYAILKGLQVQTMEVKGVLTPEFDERSRYK